jgi:tetratricopeptide (TPR) repeat protein
LSAESDQKLKIQKNKQFLDFLEKIIKVEADISEKILLCRFYFVFATYNHSGIFSSNKIENELLSIGEQYRFDLTESFEPNSFLHVLTEGYDTGGHTRILDRWINFGDQSEKHSVISMGQNLPLPDWLLNSVKEKKGEVIILEEKLNDLEKSLELRRVAAGYEYIILNVHMYETIHIMAFAPDNFKRPVLFFNHANHCFWSGVSVSDAVLSLNNEHLELSKTRRGSENNYIIVSPIEIYAKDNLLSKHQLKLPPDKKILVTLGESGRFKPIEKYDFIGTMIKILDKCPDSHLIVIGPDFAEEFWQDAWKKSGGRIQAIGRINDKSRLASYLNVADLYVMPFPYISGLFFEFIVSFSCNILFLKCLNSTNSGYEFTELYHDVQVENQDELPDLAYRILNNQAPEYIEKIKKLKEIATRVFSKEGWLYCLNYCYENTPKYHQVNKNFKDNFKITANDLAVNKLMEYWGYSNTAILQQFNFSEKNKTKMTDFIIKNDILEIAEYDYPNLFLKGLDYIEKGEYAKAEDFFIKLNNYQPENYDYLYNLGISQYNQKRYPEAVNTFIKMLKLGNPGYDLCKYLADSLTKAGDPKTAEIFYQKAARLIPE